MSAPPSSLLFGAALLGCLITTDSTRLSAQDGTVAGYVLSVRGDWRVGGTPESVASGRTLRSGDTILAGREPRQGNEIVIVLRNGDAARYRCVDTVPARALPESWDCTRPIVVPRLSGVPMRSRILDAVMSHFGKHASRPASLVSRGMLDPDLREAVAVQSGNVLDLTDALSAVPAGEYQLKFVPIAVEGAQVRKSGEALDRRVAWDPRAPMPVDATGLKAGLHELGIEGSSDVAWIMVCVRPDCGRLRTEFESIREITSQWSGISSSDVRAFVRAALDMLWRRSP